MLDLAVQDQTNILLFYQLVSTQQFELLSAYIDAGLLSAMPNGPEDLFLMQRLWHTYDSYGKPDGILNIIQRHSPQAHETLEKWYNYRTTPSDIIPQTPSLLSLFPSTKKIEQHYHYLYEQALPPGQINEKQTQIKIILSEIHELMSTPCLAVTLLNDFEEHLAFQWKKEFEFQPIPEYRYELHRGSGLYWPVPIENAPRPTLKKNSFLQRHMITYLRAHGLAQSCYKFFDSVSSEVFCKIISQADFFTENRMNPHFLLHGKTIHNLMRIVVIAAYNKGLLSRGTFTLPEIFSALVNDQFAIFNQSLPAWSALADGDYRQVLTFADPKQFHASVMLACSRSLPTLSALMRHSFCRGIFKIQEYLNKEIGKEWSVKEVWLHYISPRYLPEVSVNKSSLLTWLKDQGKISGEIAAIQRDPVEVHHLAKL